MTKQKLEKEITTLKAMSNKNIDTSDIAETLDWKKAKKGALSKADKQQVSIQLDRDVLEWFKHESSHYKKLINRACRQYMRDHQHH